MALATLSIDLVAKVASFENDLNRVAASTEAQANRMSNALGIAKAGLAGLAAGLSVGAITGFVRQINDGVDALNDIADATGASIENISALEDVAIRSGTSIDTVSGALVKFNQTLNSADPDSNAAKALEAIGLNAEELKRIDPAEALRLTAVALSKFADVGNEARIVQQLFGKSVAEVAPLLKDLAEAGQLNATVTKEQAAEAEKFNKQIFALQANVQALARSLIGDLVTGLNRAAQAYKEFGLSSGVSTLLFGDDQFRNNKRLVQLTNDLLVAEQALERGRGREPGVTTKRREENIAKLKEELKTVQAYQKVLTTPLNPEQVKKAINPTAVVTEDPKNKPRFGNRTGGKSEAEREAEEQRRRDLEVGALRNRQAEQAARDFAKFEEDRIRRIQESAERENEIVLEAAAKRQAEIDRGFEETFKRQREEAERAADLIKGQADAIGESFGKAFEDAIIGGKSLKEVLGGLADDISRIVLRKTVTEPLADQVSGILRGSGGGSIFSDIFGSIFGGARANGGPVEAGKAYLVGERGPELLLAGSSGRVVPNSAMGGRSSSVVNNFTIQGPVDRRSEAQIAKAAQRGLQRAQRWL